MYPLTSTLRVMFKTFVIAPAGIAKAVLDVFYPIIAFVGGVVGVGCAMGLGAGWAGRTALEWLTGKKRRSDKAKRGSSGDKSTKSERSLTVKTTQSKVEGSRRGKPRFATTRGDDRSHSDSASGPEIVTPKHDTKFAHQQDNRHARDEVRAGDRARKDKGSKEKSRKSAVDYTQAGYEETFRGEGRGTAREAYVLGTRKRTHGIGSAR